MNILFGSSLPFKDKPFLKGQRSGSRILIHWQTMHFFMEKHHAWFEAKGLLCKPPAGLTRSGLSASQSSAICSPRALWPAEEVGLLCSHPSGGGRLGTASSSLLEKSSRNGPLASPTKLRAPMNSCDDHPGLCPVSACVHLAWLPPQPHLISSLPSLVATQSHPGLPAAAQYARLPPSCLRAFALAFPLPGTGLRPRQLCD